MAFRAGARPLACLGKEWGSPMAQSRNTKVDLAIPATMFVGLTTTGNMMVGDKALEYYNERNVEDYIQIPWDQIDHIAASVLLGGRIIPRFAVFTKENGHFAFSTRNNHKALRAIREYVGGEKIVRSETFLGVLRAGVELGEMKKNRIEPAHGIFMAAKPAQCRSVLHLRHDDPRLTAFLRGEEIPAEGLAGYTAVAVEGVVTGFGKASGGVLKNKYPKGLRIHG